MRTALASLLLALVAAAPAAAQWGEAAPAELGRALPATCLRDDGGGAVAALGRHDGAALFAVTTDGLRADGDVAFGRRLAACPEVAVNASGAAVAAAPVLAAGRQRLLVAVRDRAGAFTLPVELARARSRSVSIEPVVAIAVDGGMLVAWRERSTRPASERVAIRVARRPPGGGFGPPQTVVERAAGRWGADAPVAAGFDAAGTATLAWARPLPARRARGGLVGGLAAVEVAAAASGAPFGTADVVTAEAQEVGTMALAVAPDGRALLAHDGNETVRVLERAPGEAAFAPLARDGGSPERAASLPAAALAADGTAVVAWRAGGAVDAVARAGPGAFARVRRLQPPQDGEDLSLVGTLYASGGAPVELDDGRPRVAAGGGGQAAVAWLAPPGFPGGPQTPRIVVAAGAAFGAVAVLGSPVRDAGAVAPRLDGGAPGAIWTDNGAVALGGYPVGAGRLRLALAARPRARPAAPRVTATARPQALFHREPLALDVRCPAACDLRATIAPRRPASDDEGPALPAVGTGGRRDAGRVRLRVTPAFADHVAPPGGGRVRVVVRSAAPDGADAARTVIHARVRRRPVPPLRVPLDVRARRAGDAVVVTWRTAGPARRMSFHAFTRRTRGRAPAPASAFARVIGRGRRSFRVRIDDARGARYVVLLAVASDPPSRTRRVVVPVR